MAQLPPERQRRLLTAGDRDAALARVGRLRRWLLAGAAALVAGIAALASALVPGRSLAAKAQRTASGGSTAPTSANQKTAPPLPPPAPAAQLGLRAPDQAPQPTPAPQPDPSQQSDPSQQPDPSQQSAPAQPAAAAQPQPQANTQQPTGPVGGGGAATSGGS